MENHYTQQKLHQGSLDNYIDSLFLISLGIILVSFAFWRNSVFLPSWIRNLWNFQTHSTVNQVQQPQPPQQSHNSTTSTESNNESSINNNNSTTTQIEEPFREIFSDMSSPDLINIKILHNENVYNRYFDSRVIKLVSDLKKYMYPNEYQRGQRIMFIHNGRPMLDTNSIQFYFNNNNSSNNVNNSNNNINSPPLKVSHHIHCIIREPLTSDQMTNDPNYMNTSNSSTVNNINYNNYYNSSAFTWMCTKTLYILTGVSLTLLWALQIGKPKLFDYFSSVLLVLFTLGWGLGFYSSLKFAPIIPQANSQNQASNPLR
ncbi:hypothetical protein DLAC_04647 [Tieghemostelium lacteum]|uniref:Ubiquitin-like domain-containing protein n=1 Tax=Tieghemostelium lacteum TaxID=361077 RepID=A0A151ZK29_TIELA|nr:hypothetical protein DLAC_04647 [Tieghemostelium lacteum]|eukprot:KYQ94351.1 hypothetical protein DLAC_04647 [Tieghemostelium lacteum]